jgi:exonuclease SbcD
MKLLHVGDIHLRDGAHMDDVVNSLEFVAETAVDEQVHAILIPGDVFERKSSPTERAAFLAWLQRLREHYVWLGPVLICRGNHDYPGDLPVWELDENVHVHERPTVVTLVTGSHPSHTLVYGWPVPTNHHIEGATDSIDLMVIPWPEKAHLAARGYAGEEGDQAGSHALANMLQTMAATRPAPERPLVIMGHLSVVGATVSSGQPLIGREIQIGTAQLLETNARHVALNHIHKHQIMDEGVVYAGSLTCHDFGEEGERKGIVLIDTDAGERFIPTPARRWVTVEARVADSGESAAESLDGVKWISPPSLPSGANWMRGANIRYRYRCTAEEQHLFDHAEIERRFAESHALKIVPLVERLERVRAAAVAEARGPIDKLRSWGEATNTEITETLVEKVERLCAELEN